MKECSERIILACRRYWNSRFLDEVAFKEFSGDLLGNGYYVVHAVDGRGRRIGKLIASLSNQPSAGAQANGLSNSPSQYVTISDLCLNTPWRGFGIGSRLFLHVLNQFHLCLHEDAILDGWVQPPEQQHFWQRFGFRFAEKDGKLYMAAFIRDLQTQKQH